MFFPNTNFFVSQNQKFNLKFDKNDKLPIQSFFIISNLNVVPSYIERKKKQFKWIKKCTRWVNDFKFFCHTYVYRQYKMKYKIQIIRQMATIHLQTPRQTHHKEKRHIALIQHHMSCLMRNSIKSHFGLTFTRAMYCLMD